MSKPIGFERNVPAALGLVEAAEQQIDLLVEQPIGMVAGLKAAGTLAERHIKRCHRHILRAERPEPNPIVHLPFVLR